MSKQTRQMVYPCQARRGCAHEVRYGIYAWAQGATDVNLDRPIMVTCGRHKVRHSPGVLLRNVRVRVR